MCYGGLALERPCAPGLHWSEAGQWCTTKDQAECQIEFPLCPEVDNPEQLIFIPSLADCERYYLCHQGVARPMYCAPNFHFNPSIGQCDFPELAMCEVEGTPEPETEPGEIEVDCPAAGVFWVAHPNTCEYYFMCVDGDAILRHCAPGLFFDSVTNRCDVKENAVCSINPQPQPL